MGLTNNDILKKLRVALKMRDDEIIHVLSLVDFERDINASCGSLANKKAVGNG